MVRTRDLEIDFRRPSFNNIALTISATMAGLQLCYNTPSVNVRNPNVRILALLNLVWLLNRSDFERSVIYYNRKNCNRMFGFRHYWHSYEMKAEIRTI